MRRFSSGFPSLTRMNEKNRTKNKKINVPGMSTKPLKINLTEIIKIE